MRTHPTDDKIRGLARVRDDALRGADGRPAARALLDDITTLPPGPVRARRRVLAGRRPLMLAAAAATVLAAAAAVGLTMRTGGTGKTGIDGNDVRLAAAVHITRKSTYYEARIVDPRADQQRFRAAFAKYGLDIDVKLVPASPSVVGTIVFEEEDGAAQKSERDGAGIKMIYDRSCRTASGADCSIGLRIPLSFKGHAAFAIGRKAAPGEPYSTTNPKDAPRGLRGLTVAAAEAALAKKGLRATMYNVGWTLPDGTGYSDGTDRAHVDPGWKVSWVEPYAPGAVLMMIRPTGPVPADVLAKARDQAAASPTVTPYRTQSP